MEPFCEKADLLYRGAAKDRERGAWANSGGVMFMEACLTRIPGTKFPCDC